MTGASEIEVCRSYFQTVCFSSILSGLLCSLTIWSNCPIYYGRTERWQDVKHHTS